MINKSILKSSNWSAHFANKAIFQKFKELLDRDYEIPYHKDRIKCRTAIFDNDIQSYNLQMFQSVKEDDLQEKASGSNEEEKRRIKELEVIVEQQKLQLGNMNTQVKFKDDLLAELQGKVQ